MDAYHPCNIDSLIKGEVITVIRHDGSQLSLDEYVDLLRPYLEMNFEDNWD